MKKKLLVLALAGAFLSGNALAASISVNPASATAPLGGGPTSPAAITVDYDPEGGTADAVEVELTFDDTAFDVTVSGSCGYTAGSGVITVITFDAFGNPIPAGTLCTTNFVATAAATEQTYPLTLQNPVLADGGVSQPAPTLNDGAITVQAAPADANLVYAPASGSTITFGGGTSGGTVTSSIAVTASGTSGSGSVTGCTLGGATPGAFAITSAFPVTATVGGSGGSIDLECTLSNSAATATLSCTESDSSVSNPSWNLSCPAGDPVPAPEYTSTPAPGSLITCNGAAGAVVNRSIVIENTGFVGDGSADSDLTFSCSVAGAGFALTGTTTDTLAVGESATVGIECTVPATEGVTNTGSVTCTSDDPVVPTATYDLSSGIVTAPPPVPQAAVIPANSLWSLLALFGVMAGIGAVVVGLRRH